MEELREWTTASIPKLETIEDRIVHQISELRKIEKIATATDVAQLEAEALNIIVERLENVSKGTSLAKDAPAMIAVSALVGTINCIKGNDRFKTLGHVFDGYYRNCPKDVQEDELLAYVNAGLKAEDDPNVHDFIGDLKNMATQESSSTGKWALCHVIALKCALCGNKIPNKGAFLIAVQDMILTLQGVQ